MAAPIENTHGSLGKMIFETSSLDSPKSKHRSVILQHYFNHSISVVLPDTELVLEDVNKLCLQEKSYLLHQLPLIELIHTDLIDAFIKRGRLQILTHNRHIDRENCVAVLPTGHLVLHLTKDTYQCLGLEGQLSQYPHKKSLKYVVNIDLLDQSFRPGKRRYERVHQCFKDYVVDLQCDYLCTWTPSDEAVCSSSIQKYFQMKGYRCKQVTVKSERKLYTNVSLPDLNPTLEQDGPQDHVDVFDWLGGVANGIGLMGVSDNYVNTFSYPGPTVDVPHCLCSQYTGMFTPATVHLVLDNLRKHLKISGSPWCSMTVDGFMDSPVSWSKHEHGFLHCGDNSYTFVLFPNYQYWCYKTISPFDVII